MAVNFPMRTRIVPPLSSLNQKCTRRSLGHRWRSIALDCRRLEKWTCYPMIEGTMSSSLLSSSSSSSSCSSPLSRTYIFVDKISSCEYEDWSKQNTKPSKRLQNQSRPPNRRQHRSKAKHQLGKAVERLPNRQRRPPNRSRLLKYHHKTTSMYYYHSHCRHRGF